MVKPEPHRHLVFDTLAYEHKNQTDVELFEGYVYTDVTLSPCDHPTRPWISHDNPRPIRWMEDEVLEGREIQLRLKKANARWKGGRVFYAFKMDGSVAVKR